MVNKVRTRNVIVHACLQASFTVTDHLENALVWNRQERETDALACAVSAMIGVRKRPLCISYARISSVASIPPMNGIDTSI